MDGHSLIAVTAGDVAGIGPEIIVRSLADKRFPASCQCVLIGHPRIFEHAAQLANVSLSLSPIAAEATDANEFRQQVSQLLNAGFQPYWNPCGDAVLSAPQCRIPVSGRGDSDRSRESCGRDRNSPTE